jgi:hypothetical protein
MNRIDCKPEQPRRPVRRYGEGLSLVELGEGLGADFIRGGGDACPICKKPVDHDDLCIIGHTVTAEVRCECGFRALATYRLVDATLPGE